MPRFQLEIAVGLNVSATVSAVLLYLNRSNAKEGKIRLPLHAVSDAPQIASEEMYPDGDPFDVTTSEDLLDGYPLREEKFWTQMRRRKIFLSITIFLLVLVQAARPVLGGDIVICTLNLVFALYLFAVAAFSVTRQTVRLHTESVWHLASLTTLAAPLMGFTAILPGEDLPVLTIEDSILPGLWYTAFALYVVALLTALDTRLGPDLHYPPSAIYTEKTTAAITNTEENNVSGVYGASPLSILFFSYSTPVVMLGNTAASLEIGDLPILTVDMRATLHYASLKRALLSVKLPKILSWRSPQVGSGLALLYQLGWVNSAGLAALTALSLVVGSLFYIPPFFMSRVLTYLENDPQREHPEWGWVWVVCLFGSNVLLFVVTGQLWSLTTATLQARIRAQLNTVLFAKTLVRKDVASSAAVAKAEDTDAPESDAPAPDADGFSSKAQIMTLMTTDIDRVARFTHQLFVIIDAPIEIAVGTIFLYNLLGVSCFFGLGVAILCLPLNHFAGKTISGAQDNLMKARDERVALMNEVLGGIRMLKFMAWERSFEVRIMKIRTKELEYQRLNYIIEALLTGLWNMTPIVVTLVSFYHFAVVRGEALTPSIAFTSIIVFNELKFALAAVPETLIAALQGIISLRRIEKYLHTPEVTPVPPIRKQSQDIAFQSCNVTWPQDRSPSSSVLPSVASTPRYKFILMDLTLKFPPGELSLICGKLGSGKTLLLLALLGEADILGGQMLCPRSPADSLASFAGTHPKKEDWVIAGICAYVPQAAWLQNASIKDNILFNLPYDEERYKLTLEVCALVSDLEILEDGDESEIGERGVNLSGGQKARVSLARAVYSRASILLLDDVLAAVDAHTAHHLYHSCLRGELMRGRTIILVSHHVQLCTPGAGYVVALDNGRVQFQGSRDEFQSSVVMRGLVQSTTVQDAAKEETAVDAAHIAENEDAVAAKPIPADKEKKQPRKFFEEEQRAVGRVAWPVWKTYILACGSGWYWVLFVLMFLIAAIAPVLENGWLSYWSRGDDSNSPAFYLTIYTAIATSGLILTTLRYFVMYYGAIHASTTLYKKLLQAVLFANIRFHDTISRGRLLNRFGKDFEGIDSTLPGNFGNTTIYFVSTLTTVITISFIGGPTFVVGAFLVSVFYYQVAKIYGQTCRDLRRLDSVTRSPLYSMYSETITGVTILRAFGASSKFLRDMLRAVDTNCNPSYWTWGVNRWLSIRMTTLSSIITALMALLAVLNKDISASLAGFALAFSNTITFDLLLLVREFVGLEQAMVGLERVKEYSDLSQESAEFIEPRPEPSWPEHGAIRCENLVIRYAPDLPDVLHNVTFDVKPGEKIGILGRTGSGKSTLALSFFRFVEATEGQIVVDGLDISKIGLTDLRSRLTIIPQDPTILSGTIRTTLDVFNEYEDADIFEALRRVHLVPSEDTPEEAADAVNTNLFRNLDSSVSEGGENFSTGEKQLLCMARAILKRSKILVMDEATASVDYATDELIGKTIRHEFKASTILTIAHRLRTVIDYDKVMLLDQGKIAEFDRPSVLLAKKSSKFYALCKAAGKEEFEMLKKMAGL
ncbi:multidrug resistance-associated ABC transporter [Mycena albidolilacea]|uniref:Multidrug resistance-associated ABC transporter n=1 Tax=Mycena albidolilacea TaxID=1033008 RepID=A0AAD7A579_9AGAR|nr:multidrug resistance-associated ABC transporter [Mycena albidolilacea]